MQLQPLLNCHKIYKTMRFKSEFESENHEHHTMGKFWFGLLVIVLRKTMNKNAIGFAISQDLSYVYFGIFSMKVGCFSYSTKQAPNAGVGCDTDVRCQIFYHELRAAEDFLG